MDFSTPQRALQSIGRRHPPLPADTVQAANQLLHPVGEDDMLLLPSLQTLLFAGGDRWEGLAVGLLVATHLLQEKKDAIIYTEGPRVPEAAAAPKTSAEWTLTVNNPEEDIATIATWMAQVCGEHLEHSEPRVRTLVAQAMGAQVQWAFSSPDRTVPHQEQALALYHKIVDSIQAHIAQGRDESNPQFSKSSTGALDDTTGWRALETNWQCVACWWASAAGTTGMAHVLQGQAALWDWLEYSAVTHVNRHVRAAAMLVLEQMVHAVAANEEYQHVLLEEKADDGPSLRSTLVKVLQAGLADNWSQVRMAASVLNRVVWTTLQSLKADVSALVPLLLPRMCLNRFYLAQGVKLYSHETWKLIFPQGGRDVVASHLGAVVRYYGKMCDADNHVVREAACQAIAELAVQLGLPLEENKEIPNPYAETLLPFVPLLLQALLMCFHDESWPVRDEASVACGTLCRAFPEECRPHFAVLWERWTEQLTDPIWSVRADAAAALADAYRAYPTQETQDKLVALIRDLLPQAKNQPKMTLKEYKAWQNDMEAHSDLQLYSCGSLAPKLKKKAGAGRIGCSSCGVTRPKQPWEATDGCLYLIRELLEIPDLAAQEHDSLWLSIWNDMLDTCRVSHFPQADELRTTLWKNVPAMAHGLGALRFKRLYLTSDLMDLLVRNVTSKTATALLQHAAVCCADELAKIIGFNIFLGRIEDEYDRQDVQRVLERRRAEEAGRPKQFQGKQFSPFEPPGLLDQIGQAPPHPGMNTVMTGMKTMQPPTKTGFDAEVAL